MDQTKTIAEARQWLQANSAEGANCPCCDQKVRLYKRKLNSNMARFLISLVKKWKATGSWVSYKDCVFKGRDYNYLNRWGLANQAPREPGKVSSGLWIPTQLGVDFVYNLCPVPSHVFIYDGSVFGFSDTTVRIEDALGSPFELLELLNQQ